MRNLRDAVLDKYGDDGANTLDRYYAQIDYTALWCISPRRRQSNRVNFGGIWHIWRAVSCLSNNLLRLHPYNLESWGQLWGHLASRGVQLFITINHLQGLFGSALPEGAGADEALQLFDFQLVAFACPVSRYRTAALDDQICRPISPVVAEWNRRHGEPASSGLPQPRGPLQLGQRKPAQMRHPGRDR
jgi:hypothetical protein